MVETKELQKEQDLKKLDEKKVEALRGQLRNLLSNGQAHTIQSMVAPVPHSSHADSDGWI